MPLDPEVQALLEGVRANLPAIGSVSAQEMRAIHKALLQKMPPGVPVAQVEDDTLPSEHGGIPIRIYRPTPNPRAVIIYYHGGGWTIGSIDGFDAAVRRLANRTGCTIVSVDYRLAPEHKFPAAVDDAFQALRAVDADIVKFAGKRVPIVLAGDSAGGNLSAVVSLLARDQGGPKIAAQVLIYPSTDGDIDAPTLSRFDSPFLNRDEISWFFDQYIPERAQRTDVRFAPLHAKDLSHLPPAFILTAEMDLLCEEAEDYARRLEAAGNRVKQERYLGTVHGFFSMDRGLKHSVKAMDDIAEFIETVS
ncbi:MAG: alpha/beta hydrolase [Janthinobacterium lividum]